MSNDIRAKIIKRIQALMNVTADRGASEQEVNNATAHISRLMAEHDLSYKDVETELRQEAYGAMGKNFFTGKQKHSVSNAISMIGDYFNCKSWYRGNQLVFFGEKNDVESAHMLAVMVRISMDIETTRYMAVRQPSHIHGKTARHSFMIGMTNRINTRLAQMIAERKAANKAAVVAGTSTALVVQVKDMIVAEKYDLFVEQNNLKLSYNNNKVRVRDASSYYSGQAAGDRIDLAAKKIEAGKLLLK